MSRFREGLWKVLGWAIMLGIAGLAIWCVGQLRGSRAAYNRMMFEPKPEDRALAYRLLASKFGTGVTNIRVPHVDRDIDAVYAFAQLSKDSQEKLSSGAQTRPEIGPGAIELPARDSESGREFRLFLRFTEEPVAFFAIVPKDDQGHADIVMSRFSSDQQELSGLP